MTVKNAPAEDGKPLSIADCILDALADGGSLAPRDIAIVIATRKKAREHEAWRRYLGPVKQEALHLARSGRIEFLRKGKVVDPETAKGIIRLRRCDAGAAEPESDPADG
ncbi:DUF3253 domain-containing protein [Oceanibacterium hippocampi]|uniref:DUF3253 domain-containing protein n=1 Tax=Oceanibacterium hippocampi TaxID=745714 RepID=A0A1Y5TPH1_9PROT|nr:DUF3253 domain-containing protein [Oceanibacterium hippocampi]SLN68878.1 hypothetical protein OCH7691_03137 [Oceanibacterium hippocampi]